MEKNVGGLDRFFRLAIGFACAAIVFATHEVWLRLIFGVIAVVGLGTAFLGYCPINRRLGMNTAARKRKP